MCLASVVMGAAALIDADYHRGPWNYNLKCPARVKLDPVGVQRSPATGTEYAYFNATTTVDDCAKVCCHDWSCWGFAFYPMGKRGNNSALWPHPRTKHPTKDLPCDAPYCNGDNLAVLGNSCGGDSPCCVLLSDFEDPLVPATLPGVRSGVRAKLPARDPPGERSALIKSVTFGDILYIGGDGVYPLSHGSGNWDLGDEFPTSWADDGFQYTGAGDNSGGAAYPGSDSPLTMWRINGSDPTTATFSLVGEHQAVSNQSFHLCPITKSGVPNLKSNAVLSVGKALYWAVACFDYVDPDIIPNDPNIMHWRSLDHYFNRQRYGVNDTSFIMRSLDGGSNWDLGDPAGWNTAKSADPHRFFRGRLAAPRLINAGQGYRAAPDPTHIYALFPGTTTDKAFFENNDAIWLGRVPMAKVLDRSAWQFYVGKSAGMPAWSFDDTLAMPVFEHPLMTAMQQVTYHPGLQRYLMAVWSWCDPDGNPRGQLTSPSTAGDFWGYNTTQGKDVHDRSQLTLWEAEQLWGPWRYFHRDDDWKGPDGSSGGYTPVFPPAWMDSVKQPTTKNATIWMSFTQCCPGKARPRNNYNYTLQSVTLHL